MHHVSEIIQSAGTFILAAIPVGGFMAQATDIIPPGLLNMGAGAFAMGTAWMLWKHLEKKDNDQKLAQQAALQAKDDEIKRINEDLREMRSVVLKEFHSKKDQTHEGS